MKTPDECSGTAGNEELYEGRVSEMFLACEE